MSNPVPSDLLGPPTVPSLPVSDTPASPRNQHWAIHDPETGEIVRWGNAPAGDVPPGAFLAEATPETHYVADGALVERSPAARAARAARPFGLVHTWSNVVQAWVDPRPAPERESEAAAAVRADRDDRLAATDWTQLKDVPATTADAWATYRAALRDVPAQKGFPDAISWPEPPSAVSANVLV